MLTVCIIPLESRLPLNGFERQYPHTRRHTRAIRRYGKSFGSDSLWPHGLQHTRPPLSINNSWSLFKLMSIELVMPSNHLILCRPFSSCPQSFPESGSFPMNQLFTSDRQSIRASALALVLPMDIQGWFPLGLTGLISLLSKGLSRVFSSNTIQKHQFFITQPSLWSNSHICTWLLENHSFDSIDLCWQSDVSAF